MINKDWIASFREKLDQYHTWPSVYIFKFIVPAGKEGEVKALFPTTPTTERVSKNGNYTSLTAQLIMPSSEAVIEIYQKASSIEGLIAL